MLISRVLLRVSVAHFCVSLCFGFKVSCDAQPFSWKLILYFLQNHGPTNFKLSITTEYIAKIFALEVSISPDFQVMVLNSEKQSRIQVIRVSLTDQKEHRKKKGRWEIIQRYKNRGNCLKTKISRLQRKFSHRWYLFCLVHKIFFFEIKMIFEFN